MSCYRLHCSSSKIFAAGLRLRGEITVTVDRECSHTLGGWAVPVSANVVKALSCFQNTNHFDMATLLSSFGPLHRTIGCSDYGLFDIASVTIKLKYYNQVYHIWGFGVLGFWV